MKMRIAAQLHGDALAGGGAADEVALLEERALLRVEVELHVGANPIPRSDEPVFSRTWLELGRRRLPVGCRNEAK